MSICPRNGGRHPSQTEADITRTKTQRNFYPSDYHGDDVGERDIVFAL